MISQSAQYAVRAIIHLARQPEGHYLLTKNMAEELDIPQHYLGKILQQLVRARVLKSTRGRNGGFAIATPPSQVPLRAVIEAIDDVEKKKDCILGQTQCSDRLACPLHDFWKDVRNRYVRELEHKTVAELAEFADRRKKVGLSDKDFKKFGGARRAAAARAKP